MANRTALSPSYADVNNAINGGGPFSGAATDGSIITIPAGMATWASTMLIQNKALTLQGHGIGSTIIKDGIVGSPSPFMKMLTKTGSALSPATDFVSRLTGIEFQDGGRTVAAGGSPVGPPNSGGLINIAALDNRYDGRFRWDNCKMDHLKGSVVFDTAVGLVDHNDFSWQNGSWCKVWHAAWNGGKFADGSMSGAINWGSEEFVYFELNQFNSDIYCGATDSYCGGRSCWRDNDFDNACITSHGTESGGGRMRGLVAFEIYRNHFTGTANVSATRLGLMRSGVLTIWGNRAANNMTYTGIPLAVYRPFIDSSGAGYGECNGKNNFDVNYAGGPFASGVAASNAVPNSATRTMTVSPSPNWTPVNKWRGYSVIKPLSGEQNAGELTFGFITDSTADTITYALDTLGASKTLTFQTGDHWEFWRIKHCLDMPGRRGGAIIPAVNPAQLPDGSNATGDPTADWRNNGQDQVSDPCYEWDNHRDDGSHILSFGVGESYTIRAKVTDGDDGHYWADHRQRPGYMPLGVHSLASGATPNITSGDHISFEQGVGGTFQATATGFSGSVTYSHNQSNPGGTFPASGTTLNSAGLLTVGVGTAAGLYTFNLVATDGTDTDTQLFTLTVTATPTRVIAISGTLAFGDVDINTTATKNFTILNSGNSPLTVTDITLPSGFTASWSSGTVSPGASQLVTVTFSPVAAISYSGTVTVVSDKTSGTNTLAASGVGVTRIISLSGSLAFGDITVGQTATKQLTISNTGNRALTINSITFPTDFSGNFVGTIAAGGSHVVDVTFSPTIEQAYSDIVTVVSNKTSGTNTRAVTGNGVVTATAIIQLTGSLDFGSILTGSTLTKTLRITNGGDTTLNVSGITYPSGFTGAYAGAIAAGAFHDVVVTFSPVANILYSGTVTVASDATGGTDTTSASGTGVAPTTKIIALSGSLDFGGVLAGSTSTRTLTIANSGSAVLTVTSITLPTGFTGSFAGTINPSATQDVVITFSPLLIQSYDGTITVNSDKTSGTETIAVTGSGVQPTTRVINLTGNLAFGNVQKGHTVKRLLNIANGGTDNLVVTSITTPTGFSVDWSSGTIAPGASQDVNVSFTPVSQLAYGGDITVASNKTAGTNTITCSGNGRNKKQVPFFLVIG